MNELRRKSSGVIRHALAGGCAFGRAPRSLFPFANNVPACGPTGRQTSRAMYARRGRYDDPGIYCGKISWA
jgi:hypothetical protein